MGRILIRLTAITILSLLIAGGLYFLIEVPGYTTYPFILFLALSYSLLFQNSKWHLGK